MLPRTGLSIEASREGLRLLSTGRFYDWLKASSDKNGREKGSASKKGDITNTEPVTGLLAHGGAALQNVSGLARTGVDQKEPLPKSDPNLAANGLLDHLPHSSPAGAAPTLQPPAADLPHMIPSQHHAPEVPATAGLTNPSPTSSLTSSAPQQPATPRVTLLPISNPRQDQPAAFRSKASLFLEVFHAFRKFGQTHHRLFFLLSERLQYDDLHCQSPARIAGLAEAAHALEALEIGMLNLLRRVAWRRRHEFPFEHLNTVLWAISKVKAGTSEAQGELDLLALHWSREVLHWLDSLRPGPAGSPQHPQRRPHSLQQDHSLPQADDSTETLPGVRPAFKVQPMDKPASDADGAAGGQHEWEGRQLVRILETVWSMAAVQYRPQGTSPQPKSLVYSTTKRGTPRAGLSQISYPKIDAMSKEDEEILYRGPFQSTVPPIQRTIPMPATSNGLCLEELRLLYAHDGKRQEALDNMNKILQKARRHIYTKLDASRIRDLEVVLMCLGSTSSKSSSCSPSWCTTRYVSPPRFPSHWRRGKRSCSFLAAAKKWDEDDDNGLKPVQMLDGAVDTVANLVPSSVPRSIAKGGVYAVGGLLVFGLIQKVLSGLITLAVLGALGYLYLTRNSGGKDDDDEGGSGRRKSTEDVDDDASPLSDARRIMEKYR